MLKLIIVAVFSFGAGMSALAYLAGREIMIRHESHKAGRWWE
jgi:hypothetical protein